MRERWALSLGAAFALPLCACASVAAAPGAAEPYEVVDLQRLEETFAKLAERVSPGVVAIRSYRTLRGVRDSEDGVPVRIAQNHGAGLVIRSDGYILTNEHVIGDSDKIDVVLHDGELHDGTLVQSDARSDLAVVKIDARDLFVPPLGDLAHVRPGRWTFVVGNPFGLANEDGRLAVSFGNVAAVGKSLSSELDPDGSRYYGNLIQTTSSINPGNSGGPLFNVNGEVIGIATAMLSRSGVNEGVGFAIPISERTRRIIDALQRGELVRYGYLGVKVATPSRSQRTRAGRELPGGALVAAIIEPDGPAERAGLRAGDVITQFDGVAIQDSDHLVRLVGATPVSNVVAIEFFREGTRQQGKVRLGERPTIVASTRSDSPTRPQTLDWQQILLAEPTDGILSANGLTRADAGLVVVDVEDRSRAHAAGLRNGDIIMRYNGQRVRSVAEFVQIDRETKSSVELTLDGRRTIRFRK